MSALLPFCFALMSFYLLGASLQRVLDDDKRPVTWGLSVAITAGMSVLALWLFITTVMA